MSFLDRFRKKKDETPMTTAILTAATDAIHEIAPTAECIPDRLTLRIILDGRTLVWNLHDIVRLIATDPNWRDGMRELARKVVQAPAPATHGRVSLLQARLRRDEKVPAELRTGEYAAEHVIGDVWAVYGSTQGERFSVGKWSGVSDRTANRTLTAAMTLGGDFTPRHMMSPISEGVPVFTNEQAHPNIAAALLMPATWWELVMTAFDPRPPALLVAVPTASRIFVALDVALEMHAIMKTLVQSALEIEEDLLSTAVFRFAGKTWAVV